MQETKPRDEMTDRELLLSLHERLDRELEEQRKDIGLVCSAVRALCDVRELTDHVQALGQRLAARFPSNGIGHDEPTNPEHERPEPDAE